MNYPMQEKTPSKRPNLDTVDHPVCFFIPPYVYEEIIKNGNEQQKTAALHSLETSARLRGMRHVITQMPGMFVSTGTNKRRTIFNAHNKPELPGTEVIRSEGAPPTVDEEANEAYDHSGVTYDFYKEVLGRNSIDNRGLRIDLTVHFREFVLEPFENAFWLGNNMVYGDGNPQSSNRFTIDLAITGHEMSHGVVEYEGGLDYLKDTGAMNEHFADVFGMVIKQYHLKQDAESSNWLLGEGLWKSNIHGKALRSMKDPGTAYDDPLIGKDLQPAHMRDYKDITFDHGGVHINSGILNKAFYLTAVNMGGNAWEAPAHIWYTSLTNLPNNPSKTTFNDLANTTFAEAGKLYGPDSKEQKAVYKAMVDVGLTPKK
jgi:Zn-dependent metalloprotease